jgi:flagellar M-ring protein FliF
VIEDQADQIDISPPMAMAMDDNALGDFMAGDMLGGGGDDAVTRLKSIIADREPETLQILQDWIDESGTKASV